MAKNSNGLIVVGVLVVAVLLLTGTVQIPTFAAAAGAPSQPSLNVQLCPDTQSTNLKVAYQNSIELNSTLQYETATFDVYRSGVSIGQVTSGEGLSATALSVDCGSTYDLYFRGSSALNSIASKSIVTTGANWPVYNVGARASQVEFLLYDTGFNNETTGDGTTGSFGQDQTSTTNWAFTTGTRKDFYLQARAKSAGAQFGTSQSVLDSVTSGVHNLLCSDFNTAKFDKNSGINVVGSHVGSVLDPPAYAVSQGMDKCWVLDPIKSSDGTLQWNLGLFSNLGDPGDTDNPKFQVFDAQVYKKADGSISAGLSDDALTALGATDRYVIVNIT